MNAYIGAYFQRCKSIKELDNKQQKKKDDDLNCREKEKLMDQEMEEIKSAYKRSCGFC